MENNAKEECDHRNRLNLLMQSLKNSFSYPAHSTKIIQNALSKCVAIALVVVAAFLPSLALAVELNVSQETIARSQGEPVSISVYLSNVSGIPPVEFVDFQIQFDSSVLTLVSCEFGEMWRDPQSETFDDADYATNPVSCAGGNFINVSVTHLYGVPAVENGQVFVLEFILNDVPADVQTAIDLVSASYGPNNQGDEEQFSSLNDGAVLAVLSYSVPLVPPIAGIFLAVSLLLTASLRLNFRNARSN